MGGYKYYDLSHPQKRIFQVEKYYSNTPINNITGINLFKNPVDINLLDTAINIVIKSNDALRLRLCLRNDEIKQYIAPYTYKKIDVFNFYQRDKEYEEWLQSTNTSVFNIYDSDLYYVAIVIHPDGRGGFYFKFHHIITDAWSISTAASMTAEIYSALKNNKEYNSTKPSYIDYIISEEKYKKSQRYEHDKEFWIDQFKDIPDLVSLSHRNSNNIDAKAQRKSFKLSSEITNKIISFSKESGISVFNLMFGVLAILTSRYTGKSDFTLGTVALNRSKKEKEMQGMFITTLPIRFQIEDRINFIDFLNYVKKVWFQCLKHGKYPYDEVLSELRKEGRSYGKLYNVVMSYQNTKIITAEEEEQEPVWLFNGTSGEELIIHINDRTSEGRFIIDYDYQIQAFDERDIDAIHNHLMSILNDGMKEPSKDISNLNMLSEDEKSEIIQMLSNSQCNFPKSTVIHEIFEDIVRRFPNRTAAVYGEESLTYRQLNEKANILASKLREIGVQRETIVGILLDKSIDMLVSILAVLKAGGTYLPIDIDYPTDRQEYMLYDSEAKFLISQQSYYSKINYGGTIINFKEDLEKQEHKDNLEIINTSGDTAYIIYTSGSTGKPKGVMITHRNVVRLMKNDAFQFDFNEEDVWTVAHSFCFDFSVWEMYGALLYGGKLVIVSKDEVVSPVEFSKIIEKNGVTVLNQTPQAFYALADTVVEQGIDRLKVRYVIFGGEALAPVKLMKWRKLYPNTKLINMYGITETTVHVTFKELSDNDIKLNVSNIGKPIPTLSMYLLDKNLNIQPINVPGEICVAGEGVAKGYLNRPELTKEKFIVNPYNKNEILYRSGDLGRLLPNGDVEYLGRIDNQVKIRGFRIELGEIESKLLDVDYIKDAVVLCQKDTNGSNSLCAYIVATEKIDVISIRGYLSNYLPLYMIPSYFIQVDKIPCTSNGKVDRKALAEIKNFVLAESKYEEGRDEIENILIEVWSQVLKVEGIGINDNFFDLGGDSIKAIQIVSRLQRYNLKLDVKNLLKHPVLSETRKYVEKTNVVEIYQGTVTGDVELTPIQREFFSNNKEDINHFNHQIILKSKHSFEECYVRTAFEEIVKHHDALRMVYRKTQNEVFQFNRDINEKLFDLKVFDIRNEVNYNLKIKEISQEINKSINLEEGPLVKLAILKTIQGDLLLIVIHHLVVDGVSWRIILEDFENALNQLINSEPIKLQNKTTSFKEWAHRLKAYSDDPILQKELEYWAMITNKSVSSIPTDNNIKDRVVKNISTNTLTIPKEKTDLLLFESNKAFNTEINDLLIAALALSLEQWRDINKFFVNMESHGRTLSFDGIDLSRTVGWFTATYPLFIEVDSSMDLSKILINIKETIRKVPNKGIGYGILKYLSSLEGKSEINFDVQPEIGFNYLGQVDDSINTDNFEKYDLGIEASFGDNIKCIHKIEINAMIVDGKLEVRTSYDKEEYNKKSIETLMNLFMDNLIMIAEYCAAREEVAYSVSDFDDSELSQEELDEISKLFN